MSLSRYAKRKDASQASIVKALRKAGVYVIIQDHPDLLTYWMGLWLPLEIKSENGKLTPRQVELVAKTKCPVVRDELEALRAVGVL
jgi:hypothetical protein